MINIIMKEIEMPRFEDMQPPQALEAIAALIEEQYDSDGDYVGDSGDFFDTLQNLLVERELLAACNVCDGIYATFLHDECPYQEGENEHQDQE